LVEKGSLKKTPESLKVEFSVTDNNERLTVRYEGILPDLFREGQGVIAQGRLQPDKVFVADQVLAKHDENYMPPEVAKTLKPVPAANAKKL
jgi:cytochrome c-type biogenesis protein CcmE